MIGKINSGKSAYHLLRYCLEDKKELTPEQKDSLSLEDGLQHNQRAQVLDYHNCFGDYKELNTQFRDVEQLSKRVEKPVFHITLRLAGGDQLTNAQWVEIADACAKEFDFSDHQYLTILHKDAKEPQIHIAANRIGLDGKAAIDSNSYKRIAAFCRRMEKQYDLKEVLSPRAFLDPKERQLPRQDNRKQKLQADLKEILSRVSNYAGFEKEVKALGYQVIKARGISFIDDKKVKIKGSEVGFSLATIEKILIKNRLNRPEIQVLQEEKPRKKDAFSKEIDHAGHRYQPSESKEQSITETLLGQLMNPIQEEDYIPYGLRPKKKKKKI